MNNSTFIRFCRFGFWFRICGFGFGIWVRNSHDRFLVKHRRGGLLAQWISVRVYKS
jgi:hypothetical protein